MKKIYFIMAFLLLNLLAIKAFPQPGAPPDTAGTVVVGGTSGTGGTTGTTGGTSGFAVPIDGGALFLLLMGGSIVLGYNIYLMKKKSIKI